MRPTAERGWSGSGRSPTVRGSHKIPSTLRSPSVGRRHDGEPAQPATTKEATKDDRHPHSKKLQDGVIRDGDRAGRVPPFELQALALRRVYDKRKISRLDGRATTPPPDNRPPSSAREEAKRETWERWRSQLVEEDTTRQHRAVRAVLPNWETWREQGGVPLTFRMTQMLTGHGVFGEYLLRIRREVTSICHQCEEEEDTVQHTWERCPAWADQHVLQLDIGESVAREAIVKAMLRGHQEYTAVRSFCEQVMLAKERAEREKKRKRDPARVERQRIPRRNRGGGGTAAAPARATRLGKRNTRDVVPS
ncbi:uncharacterized protein LOC132915699 [Bombus pascuorum]|uniref:uncharacterized protein LOC132915699 n=1 Tax=Bombus pascuorum TaxID=65598 RepID=UPI00298E0683|nr:uncharacterized protein LOC132915699 [Bombus pascuorum]